MTENDLIAYALTLLAAVQVTRASLAYRTARRRDQMKARGAS